MQILNRALFLIVLFFITTHLFAQRINDSLIARVARRFEQTQHLLLQKIIQPAVVQNGQMQEDRLPCYSGKQVTVVAIFNQKPVAAYGKMLVTKHYEDTTRYDEHLFQQAGYDQSLKVNYALISVYFPPEANFKNCNTALQVYDKKKRDNKVWLIILTK